ncbi:MAG TPA: hypothetical protein VF144_16250 [Chitinophagaceae bacterium]
MHIEINDHTSLREIQLVFSSFYPYLQIEFYCKRHPRFESSDEMDEIESDHTIGSIKKTHVSGVLEIQPLYKVADVETEFSKRFGLSVQILRKEKDGWVQTAGEDDFTLKELNELGRNSSDETLLTDYEQGFEGPVDKPEKLY